MGTVTEKFNAMTGRVSLPREFVLDFALFEQRLREDGETQAGIDEIKQAVRDAWPNEEMRNLWTAHVRKEAEFMREIQQMTKDTFARIKAQQAAVKGQQTLTEAA